MPRFLSIVFLAFAAPAMAAAPVVSCPDLSAVRAKAQSCEQNAVFSNAAHLCLDRYDAAIATARKTLNVALAKVSSADRQSQSMEHAKAGYQEAIATLKSLAEKGQALQAEVAAYKNDIILPDDFESIGAAGFDTQVFLDNNPCYKSTRDLIASYSELLGLHAKELEITGKITEELAARTFHGEKGLLVNSATPSAKSTKGKGSAAVPGGHSKSGQSDITGTEKKANK